MNPLTIFVAVRPLVNLGHAGAAPEPLCSFPGIFQALFHLDSIVRPDQVSHDDGVTGGRVKGLVASSLVVVHVLANHPPVLLDEGGLSEHSIGVAEAIEDEPGMIRCVSADSRAEIP